MSDLEAIVKGNIVKTLVFDFNGTLADDLRLFIEISRKILEKRGYKIPSDKEIEALRGEPAKEVAKTLFGHRKWIYRLPLVFGE